MHIAPDTMVDGRYRVLRRLGMGGMAEVWCAEDEVLGRNVALKLLGSRYAEDPEFRERFRREARAAAGLAHPNIVGIFDRAEWDGTPYIAMELVEGRTLKELVIERGPMPVDVATNLTVQLLKALGYAHTRGIVHRDVKPQNVIIDGDVRGQRTTVGHELLQRVPVDQLHRDVGRALPLGAVEDADDVRVRESRRGLGLAAEALTELRVVGEA